MDHIINYIRIIIFLPFLNINAFAQTTFDSGERLLSIKINSNLIDPPVAPLLDSGEYIKEQVRMLLLEKVNEAIRILKSNNYKKLQHKFYSNVWQGDTTSLLNYLNNIEIALQSKSNATITGFGSSEFNTTFNTHLSDTALVYRWLPINNTESIGGVLIKKDVFKNFITDYYNSTLPLIKDKYVKKEDIIEASYYLLEQTDTIKMLMNVYRSSANKFRKTMYDSLRKYHENITSKTSPYNKSLIMLRNDWFKHWFWLTGGDIRINPLDFGVDTIIGKLNLDLTKIDITTKRIDDNILERRLNSLDSIFISSYPKIAYTEKWVNKVTIPNKLDFQFSAIDNIKFPNNNKNIKQNIKEGEKKVIVIHNISADRKAGLLEDTKAIPNRSAFQAGLDEVITSIGELATAYGKLTGTTWSLVSNFFFPQQNYDNKVINTAQSIDTSRVTVQLPISGNTIIKIMLKLNANDSFTISGTPGDNFLAKLKNTLDGKNLMVDKIFNDEFGIKTMTFDQMLKNKISFDKQFSTYLSLITHDAAKHILEDSFMVAGMIHIYNNASSPLLRPITKIQNKAFRYYSSTLETSAYKSTVVNVVRPYTTISKTNSDNVYLEQFSYKIGKTKRFTLSAGLAYTLNSYNQSVAKEENGSINITNSSQQFRFLVGLNLYFRPLFSLNNDLGKFCERWYLFLGVGIPKSIENLYIGLGRDLYPGLKLTTGVHVIKQNKYLIQNNKIVDEKLRYQTAGPFVSVSIDPTSLINLLNVFTKKN